MEFLRQCSLLSLFINSFLPSYISLAVSPLIPFALFPYVLVAWPFSSAFPPFFLFPNHGQSYNFFSSFLLALRDEATVVLIFTLIFLQPINHVLLLPPLLETRICIVFFFSLCE
jgi:hypothetical protein